MLTCQSQRLPRYERFPHLFLLESVIAIECQLQHCINSIQSWAIENGFLFSKSKPVCVHFSNQNSTHTERDLKLYGSLIPIVTETKFLGSVFYRKLAFAAHIKGLKNECLKALNLLPVVAHYNWRADNATLLKLYQTHVRSKLDFGYVVYFRMTVGPGMF